MFNKAKTQSLNIEDIKHQAMLEPKLSKKTKRKNVHRPDNYRGIS